MKLPLLALFAVLPCLAIAQTSTNGTDNPTPPSCGNGGGPKEHRPHPLDLAHLTAALNLTADQQAEIGPILSSAADQRKAIFDNTSLDPQDKQAQLKSLHEQTVTQIEAVLTQDQVAKFQKMQQGPPHKK